MSAGCHRAGSTTEAFLDQLVPLVEALKVGDPADDETDVSALITPGDTDRVRRVIGAAVGEGATIVTGGAASAGIAAPVRPGSRDRVKLVTR